MADPQLTVVVAGMVAADLHQGGAAWSVLQYVLGLRRLGHDVYLIEPVSSAALHPAGSPLAQSVNGASFQTISRHFGLDGKAAMVLRGSRDTVGLPYEEVAAACRRADVLLNISGLLDDDDLMGEMAVRAFLDLDPAFNQLWHSAEGIDRGFSRHTHFVTVGLAIGSSTCLVPDCGYSWTTTLQPVVLERWPVARQTHYEGLTTVANFRGYGSIEVESVLYGQKAHSLREFVTLPTLCEDRFYLALNIHPDETQDLIALNRNGWDLVDPVACAGTPWSYQRFVQGSKAELGIAKSGYVISGCGWFSDRSACYLASGRPVIAQETGFSRFLPTGQGLLAFSTVREALECLEVLRTDYPDQARGARALAEEHFDSDRVLGRLLDQLGFVP